MVQIDVHEGQNANAASQVSGLNASEMVEIDLNEGGNANAAFSLSDENDKIVRPKEKKPRPQPKLPENIDLSTGVEHIYDQVPCEKDD